MFRAYWLVTLAAACLYGQGTDAVLTGTVTDPTGAAIPGAVVKATNAKTGVAATTQSNDTGV